MAKIYIRSVSILVPDSKASLTADPRVSSHVNHTTATPVLPVAGLDPQAALLALLTQAAASTTAVPAPLVPYVKSAL